MSKSFPNEAANSPHNQAVSMGARPLKIDRQYINQDSALAPFLNEKADEFERFWLSKITLPTVLITEMICALEQGSAALWDAHTPAAQTAQFQVRETLKRARGLVLIGMLDRFLRCFQ